MLLVILPQEQRRNIQQRFLLVMAFLDSGQFTVARVGPNSLKRGRRIEATRYWHANACISRLGSRFEGLEKGEKSGGVSP